MKKLFITGKPPEGDYQVTTGKARVIYPTQHQMLIVFVPAAKFTVEWDEYGEGLGKSKVTP